MGTAQELNALGVSASSADAAIAQLDGAAPTLVLLECPDPQVGYAAALRLAASGIPDGHEADLRRAEPDEDRWRTHEVSERIIAPAALKAFTRGHVVVADADQMTLRLHDHLLKTVEEPASNTQFWFCVRRASDLPATLRGRAGVILSLATADPQEQLAALVDAGRDPELAREAVALAGANARLADIGADQETIAHLRTFATCPLTHERPTVHADAALHAVIALATRLSATPGRARRTTAAPTRSKGPRPRWDSLTPAGRVEARRLVRQLLQRWSGEASAQVAHAETATALRRVETGLRALHEAALELSSNAPAATVLPALVARASA